MLALFVNLLMWRGSWAAQVSRDVVTSQGVVRGYLTPRPPHFAFLGVPYARPTRHDRFKAPKPPRPWDGTFEATHRVKCPQPDGVGTEDCLVVNVFTPQFASALPVLVLVHGGGFQHGWGPIYPPTRLLTRNFVIVTFNYRIGALGFLCLGTPEVPGNAGLKDQVAALYWIHRNIANFGGNPYDVTVHGIEAGAASVQFLLISGSTKGLFQKAILESGSALSPLSLSYEPISTAMDAAAGLGYRGPDSSQELAIYYKELPSKELVNTTSLFLPCLENSLQTTHSILERDPLDVLKAGDYQMVPMIIAYTDGAANIKRDLNNFAFAPESFEHMLPNNLEFDNDAVKEKVTLIIKDFYLGKLTSTEAVLNSCIDYIKDITYEYPIIKSALLHASTDSSPVYIMKFYDNADPKMNNYMNKHIFDYFYESNFDGEDDIKVKRLITLWSNFIKVGDPTPLTTFLVPEVWQPIPVMRRNELNVKRITGVILSKTIKMNKKFADERIIFWDHIYKKFYRQHNGLN